MPANQPKGPLGHDVRMMISRHDSYQHSGANLAERRASVRARTQARVEASTSRLACRVQRDDALFDVVVTASEEFRAAVDASAVLPKVLKGQQRRDAWAAFLAALAALS